MEDFGFIKGVRIGSGAVNAFVASRCGQIGASVAVELIIPWLLEVVREAGVFCTAPLSRHC